MFFQRETHTQVALFRPFLTSIIITSNAPSAFIYLYIYLFKNQKTLWFIHSNNIWVCVYAENEVRICFSPYMCICIQSRTHIHVHMHTHVCVCVCVCLGKCAWTFYQFMYIYIYIYMHATIHTHIHTHINTHTCINTYVYKHTHSYTHTYIWGNISQFLVNASFWKTIRVSVRIELALILIVYDTNILTTTLYRGVPNIYWT